MPAGRRTALMDKEGESPFSLTAYVGVSRDVAHESAGQPICTAEGNPEKGWRPGMEAMHGAVLFFSGIKDDGLVKSPRLVMPDLIRHPEHIENTGFRPPPE